MDLSEAMETENGDNGLAEHNQRHVQISFFSKDEE